MSCDNHIISMVNHESVSIIAIAAITHSQSPVHALRREFKVELYKCQVCVPCRWHPGAFVLIGPELPQKKQLVAIACELCLDDHVIIRANDALLPLDIAKAVEIDDEGRPDECILHLPHDHNVVLGRVALYVESLIVRIRTKSAGPTDL
jgi:hypothetical protein